MLNVLLPSYNEESALPLLVPRIGEALGDTGEWRILVVDDGSKDGTGSVARDLSKTFPLALITHEVNQGLGAAMRTGLRAAVEGPYACNTVVAMDADNTHDPNFIPAMVKRVKEGADVVIASRYAPGGEEIGLSPHRKLLSHACSKLLYTAFPIQGARDYSCGYRAYRTETLRDGFSRWGDALIEENSFVCMAELLIKLALMGAVVDEVGLVLRYDLKEGASKMKVAQTIKRYFRLIRRKKEICSYLSGT